MLCRDIWGLETDGWMCVQLCLSLTKSSKVCKDFKGTEARWWFASFKHACKCRTHV